MHDDRYKTNGSFVGAAAVGAIAGAAAAFLSSRDNREKLKKSFNELMETGEERIDQVQDKVVDMKDRGKKVLAKGLENARNGLEDKKEEAEQEAKKMSKRTRMTT
jgi:gas vesicle protein